MDSAALSFAVFSRVIANFFEALLSGTSDTERGLRRLKTTLPQIREVMNTAETLRAEAPGMGMWIDQVRNAVEASERVFHALEHNGLQHLVENREEVGGSTSRPMKLKIKSYLYLNPDGKISRKLKKALQSLDQASASVQHIQQFYVLLRFHNNPELQHETSITTRQVLPVSQLPYSGIELEEGSKFNELQNSAQEMQINEIEELREEEGETEEQQTSNMTGLNNYRESEKKMMSEIEGLRRQNHAMAKKNAELTNERDDIKWRFCKEQSNWCFYKEELKRRLCKEESKWRLCKEESKWRTFEEESTCSSNHLDVKLTDFTRAQLWKVTNGFSDELKIGEGGYGPVYQAKDEQPFAIKIARGGSLQVDRAFRQEVEILSKFRHQNIVKLLGKCEEAHAFIYELMPNNSLHDNLIKEEKSQALTWKKRICIASDVCRALVFIHSGKSPDTLVHGDIKPANILLDSNYTAKLHDFGISRHLHRTNTTSTLYHYTNDKKGTPPYWEPEYFQTGEMTIQCDVYSFGIVLLELVTGRNPINLRNFAEDVEDALRKGQKFEDAFQKCRHSEDASRKYQKWEDVFAGGWPPKEAKRMLKLGLACSDSSREKRPNLVKNVTDELESMRRASLRYP